MHLGADYESDVAGKAVLYILKHAKNESNLVEYNQISMYKLIIFLMRCSLDKVLGFFVGALSFLVYNVYCCSVFSLNYCWIALMFALI